LQFGLKSLGSSKQTFVSKNGFRIKSWHPIFAKFKIVFEEIRFYVCLLRGHSSTHTHTLIHSPLSLSLYLSLSLCLSVSLSPLLTLSDGKKAKLQNKMANHFLGRKAHKVVEANVKKYKN
jgi:hypothetical protein